MTERQSERRGWHFEKTISAGNVLTAIIIAASVMTWAATMDKRLALVEKQQQIEAESNKEKNVQQDQAMFNNISEIRERLREVSAKLDRVIEQRASRLP